MRPSVANQCRPDQKPVAIEFNRAAIVVVMKTSLDRVTLANEILPEDVGDVNVLMARVEAIQTAVCVLLEHREVRTVELDAIVVQGAQDARTAHSGGESRATQKR